MRGLLIGAVLAGLVGLAPAAEAAEGKPITGRTLFQLGYFIKGKGFVCDQATKGSYLGRNHYGQVTRVWCGRLAYTVIMRPGARVTVFPWRKGGGGSGSADTDQGG